MVTANGDRPLFSNVVVLMTALVPTVGHVNLINFANKIGAITHVIVSERSNEPTSGKNRISALYNDLNGKRSTTRFHLHSDDNAPQNPDPTLEFDDQFWKYWETTIRSFIGHPPGKIAVVGSEPYCAIVAKILGGVYVPYDVGRTIHSAKGTNVRENISRHWTYIAPSFRKHLSLNVVMFGQESVGKTTMAKSTARDLYNGRFIPEWARLYLEQPEIGPEVTGEKMDTITLGQYSVELNTINDPNYQINVFDTDLLSTIGYYRIFGGKNDDINGFYDQIRRQSDRLYILLPDDIPFEPDILRYGDGVRESTYQFWKDLLVEFGCNFVEVPRGLDIRRKRIWIHEEIIWHLNDKYRPIKEFTRE